jgi:hypothetical protein
MAGALVIFSSFFFAFCLFPYSFFFYGDGINEKDLDNKT